MIKLRWESELKETELGRVPREWEIKKLNQILIKIKKGKTPKKIKGDYPYLSAKYLRDEEEVEKKYDKNAGIFIDDTDVIVLWDGSNAGEIFRGKKGLLASTMCKLEFEEQINKSFIYTILKSREEEIKDSKSGSDDRHVDKNFFLDLSIPYPSPTEQSRIATVLSWFDDLIENKKRQNELLEKTAMALFKSWFIDFEPFRDGKFVDSELGRIPEGWEVKAIGKVAKFRNGLSYRGEEKFDEPTGYVFITLNNVLRGGGFKIEYSWITSNRINEHQFLKESDLIVANTDMTQEAKVIGSPAIVVFPYDYEGKGAFSHHITKVIVKNDEYKLFLYLFLKITQDENTTFSTGTNVLGLDINNFKVNKLIIDPPPPILHRFHSLVSPLFEKILNNQKQIMLLRKVRDTLLPLLVFGRLRVEEL